MKLGNLQYINKTPWLYVQQGKCPPINIQNFLNTCVLIYFHDIWMLEKKPELLTLPFSFLYYMAKD